MGRLGPSLLSRGWGLVPVRTVPKPLPITISLTGAADSDTNISLTDCVRLVRTNGNAGPSGDVLRICPHLISRSSPLEVTRFESGYQVLDRKRLLFP